MVTEQEIKNRVFTVDFEGSEHSFLVTDSQMRGFNENRRKLAAKINEYLLIFEKEHNYSRNRTYEELIDLCQQSGDTLEERRKTKWYVPHGGKKGKDFGFGRSNIWYAKGSEKNEKLAEFLETMINQIESYNGNNLIDEEVE